MRKRLVSLVLIMICLVWNSMSAQNIPLPEHPRPDFERTEWINLNGKWQFTFNGEKGKKAAESGTPAAFDREIMVPFSWGSAFSGVPNEGHQGWYGRSVTIPEEWEGKRIYLVIGASEWNTQAWLNGKPLGNHQGGYTPFEFELTQSITTYGQLQNLVISADDAPSDKRLGGKQGYGDARGLWQTVYLEARGGNFVDYVHFTPDIDRSTIKVEVGLDQLPEKQTALRLRFRNGEQADFVYIPNGKARKSLIHTFEVKLQNQQLWDLDNPYLYEMEVALTEGADKTARAVDAVNTYFGQRKISVMPLPGTSYPYIALNGKPVYMELSLDQSYHPEGFYTFPSDAFMREEIMLSKRLGLNGNRIHIKVEIPRKLYWADRLGLLIMADVPNWWGEVNDLGKADWEHCMRQQVKRDYNHPSIFSWINFNETWGLFTKVDGKNVYKPETQEWVRQMYHLTKSLDATRLVEDNSPCNLDHVETDINTWHAYAPGFAWESMLENNCRNTVFGSKWNYIGNNVQANAPMLNSECGNVWGYEGSTGDVDITWDYHKMMNAFRAYPQCAGWLYTEHHDVINEWNGYVRFDRTPKTFGMDAFVPDMTIADFHTPYYLSPRCELMQEVQAGSRAEVPMYLSVMTDKDPGKMTVETSIAGWDELGHAIKEQPVSTSEVEFTPYMNTLIQPVSVVLPEQNGLYTVRFVLRGEAGNILHRNFILYRVNGGKTPADYQQVQLVSFNPADYSKAQWSYKQWNVMDHKKVNGAGDGFFEYKVKLPADLNLTQVDNILLTFEASAKQLFGKDAKGLEIINTDMDFMKGRGTLDPCMNQNAYAQTDEKRFPSMVRVVINGKVCGDVSLEDDPADHRGALSWFAQGKVNKLQEAGSYGYLVEVNVPKEILKAGQPVTVRLEVPQGVKGGLAIYGKHAGRYPMNPTFVFTRHSSPYDKNASVMPVDISGMEHTAEQLASRMKVGWNLGNSLDAYGDNPAVSETSWGNPETTKSMIDSVAKAGFNAIRIPIRWYPHFKEDKQGAIKIDKAWMRRVKQLVDWSRENDMYVIINTHHEKWLESHPLYKDSAEVYRKERALWKEIAVYFRDYDEHLLFAGTNEVHIPDNWGRPEQENVDVQNGFNQVFIDAVRATGGRNAYRTLIVQTYVTNYEFGPKLFCFPTDPTPGRMMVEMHFYDPWNYCGLGSDKYWGKPCNRFGVDGEAQETRLKFCLASLKPVFTDKGYPIIIGECGVVRHEVAPDENREAIESARGHYLEMMVSECRKNGAIPFLWDNGSATGAGQEQFGLFNRKNGMKEVDNVAIPAIMKGTQTSTPW